MQHRPRKRFGQNFLTDGRFVRKIVDVVAPGPGQLILEIGPGQAALTRPLAKSGAELHLLEIDRDLARRLEAEFAGAPNVRVHAVDALQADLAEVCGGRPFRLLGNLPYNISTPLLFHVLRWRALVIDMHFMLQREVVERMAAPPGGKRRGRLSVTCQYYCAVTPLFTVPPEAFTPRPGVESAVVRLVPHQHPPVDAGDPEKFERLVARAFSMRRKTLRNSLRGVLGEPAFEAAGVDPGLRPEVLSLEQFAALSRQLDQRDGDADFP
jgi:16S rRNA (adenine1518-N6/adenine1519-N6)-dimethyltransferase